MWPPKKILSDKNVEFHVRPAAVRVLGFAFVLNPDAFANVDVGGVDFIFERRWAAPYSILRTVLNFYAQNGGHCCPGKIR